MTERFLNGRVIVKVGDITLEQVDAIVNAANSTLLGGGGVDGAIHNAGGPRILEECRAIRRTQFPDGLPAGEAVITGGGDLPARFVIHTVGPIYGQNNGRDAEVLTGCYRNSLALAAASGITSIAFPAISTGVYRFPKDEAARCASEAIAASLLIHPSIGDIRLVFFSPADAATFVRNCTFTTF